MASIINADTSSGLKLTSDTSGVIEFQSAGTTKAGVNSTGLTGDGSQLTGLAAGIEWQSSIVTASTLTAVANRGYWIDTTSNEVDITLPSSPAVGDELIFVDYARTWQNNQIIIRPNGQKYNGLLPPAIKYDEIGLLINIVYSGATKGWITTLQVQSPTGTQPATQRAIFAYGGGTNVSNLVTSVGVVGTDVTGVGNC